MPPKKRARRDDVATGGLPPPTPPTEVNKGKKGPKRTRKQSETDTVNVLPNIDYDLLAKEIVNQQKADSEKQNIGESVGQPPMVNSVEDTAPVIGEAIPAAATIPASAAATFPASALGTLLDNVFTESQRGSTISRPTTNCHSRASIADLSSTTQTILVAALSPSARLSYRRSWELFLTFRNNPVSLPLSTIAICNFIGFLFEKQYSSSSIASHVSAMSYIHKIVNAPDLTQTFIV
ncbi:uncharacterized protein [Magallana gigas]|uniref:uncharacterized protein n=1 Tax=Magallana gigas TaxID=29159 RepID=UPI0033418A5E